MVGLAFGLFSAFIYAIRNLIVKTQIDELEGSVVMTYQTGVTVLLLLPVFHLYDAVPSAKAVPYLVGLGVLTTAVGHTLFLGCFRYFSVSTASLLSCIQPVYGILLGVLFFQEIPEWSAAAGGTLILAAVGIEALHIRKSNAPTTER